MPLLFFSIINHAAAAPLKSEMKKRREIREGAGLRGPLKTFRDANARKRAERETRHLLPVTLARTALTYAERRRERRRRRSHASSSGSWAPIDTTLVSVGRTLLPGSGSLPRSSAATVAPSCGWALEKQVQILTKLIETV